MDRPRLAYLVCATPRSGSTLLCESLKRTGVAGRPEEFFEARRHSRIPRAPHEYFEEAPELATRLEVSVDVEAPDYSSLRGIEDYAEHLERSFELGTGANGVFGAKLMWGHLADFASLVRELPELAGVEGLRPLLDAVFGEPRYVWVRRVDTVRQAVSLWRAMQTQTWRSERGAAGGDERPDDADLVYSRRAIGHLVAQLEGDDRAWADFFARSGATPVEVVYEDDLHADAREGTVRRVLDHLGVPAPSDWHLEKHLKRQADELSERWVATYRRETAADEPAGVS